MDLKERFLKYVSYDTQSSEESTTFPSTEKQKVLLAALRDEMEALGMTEVTMDQYGYVMGTVPASKGCENADRKSTRLNSSHSRKSRMPSSA